MATVDPATLLADALGAQHALLTGKAAVTVRDSNGESVTYNIANVDKLKAYIKDLQEQVAGTIEDVRPMRMWF